MSNRSIPPDKPIHVGISACLLGQEVRYDGHHKHDRFLTETLGQYFQWVPVCPEVELGLGTPRPIIRLERHDGGIQLIMPEVDHNLTEAMRSFAQRRVEALAGENLSGFLLKRGSPSCGVRQVKVHEAGMEPAREGTGLFAEALIRRFPNLPVEDEDRLRDPHFREDWIARVSAYHREDDCGRR